ncbi:YbaB/EbfC family nucleoid-associated protein [Candidatus Falkowbacteria bacterium]|nr:YbaB/EbfC family nucleoid-associated protein [Candidatus Falkowbacteria bacterium]
MFNKLKQIKDLRSQAKQIQSKMAEETLEVEKNGIKILINGNQEIIYYKIINTELLNPEKASDLESALKEATNKAVKDAQKMMAQKMMASGDFNLPGM